MKGIMKATFREIRTSMGRYMAILLIVALGVGFFSGLKSAYDAMVHSADVYWTELSLFDYQLISTLAFEEDAAEKLEAEEGVLAAEGTKSADIIMTADDNVESEVKTLSIPEKINKVSLTLGRMPQREDECLADDRRFGKEDIGRKIKLAESNESEDADLFRIKEYTIVGTVRSPLYTLFERGVTSLGDGTIDYYLYLPEEAYDMDYDTGIYVAFEKNAAIYSPEYETLIEEQQAGWETRCRDAAGDRYHRIYAEAMDELAAAEEELAERQTEGEQELQDAFDELANGQEQLAEGRNAIQSAREELAEKESLLAAEEEKYLEGVEAYNQKKEDYDTGKAVYDEQETAYEEALAAYEAVKDYLSAEERIQKEEELAYWRTALDTEAAKRIAAEAALQQGQAQVDEAGRQIEAAKAQLASGREALEANAEALTEMEGKLADGWIEYEDGRRKFEDKIADAESEIAAAREELEDLEEPDTYVLDRKTNMGYASFENDSKIIMGVARVFPIFFLLVAALVCMTTMTRMIEEQRTQIGVLKALGYSNAAIIGKYLIYSGSAAAIGSVLGYFAGTWIFTEVIWIAYKLLYNFKELHFALNGGLAVLLLVIAMLCCAGTTFMVCNSALKEMAAALMRPKAPKAGKRVVLERISFVWKRLKFLDKVSVRNLFRYKRRFFMMIIGVSGCTALLVTGLGIKDSIADIAATQFEEISLYDIAVGIRDEKDIAVQGMEDSLPVSVKSVDMVYGEEKKSITLLIPQDTDVFSEYMDLHTKKGREVFFPQENELLITDKLAELYGLEGGDEITLRDEEGRSAAVMVSGSYTTYFNQYMIMSQETYQNLFGEPAENNQLLVKVQENADVNVVGANLMKQSDVTMVTLSADVQNRIADMMKSLDYVVLLVIACAAMLAFVVIYNLNNINITERVREIATIKVLGFYKEETASYVFRENFVLTLIAGLAGVGLGYFLHAFVMSQIKIEMMAFDVKIKPVSYILSVMLTILFNWIVNRFMAGKLDHIDMAESLKSVE